MSIEEQLRRIAEAMGEPIDDDMIRDHVAFCGELEENIFLREAGEVVERLSASAVLLLVRGEYKQEVKDACRALHTLVLNQCALADQDFAEEVRNGLAEILAPDLVPTLVVLAAAPGNGSTQ